MRVASTVLLAMSEDMGTAIKDTIKSMTDQLTINPSIISIAHSLSSAIVRYKPDIVLMNPSVMTFDTANPDDELIKDIYAIRANPAISSTRIAAIVKQGNSQEFISKLVGLQVWDIFLPNSDGRLSIENIISQLTKPPSIKNAEDITDTAQAIQSSLAGAGQTAPSMESVSAAPSSVNSNELQALKEELAQARKRESALAASMDTRAVDRSDYDDLRKQINDRVKAASLTESLTNQFQSIMDSYDKQQKKLDLLSKTVKDQNKLLAENEVNVNAQSQLNDLKRENSNLRQQLGQANSRISSLQASAMPMTRESREREDSYESDHKASSAKPILIAAGLIVAVTIIALLFIILTHSSSGGSSNSANSISSSASAKPTFTTLIKEQEYAKAAKEYPTRAVEAENQMLLDSDVDNKSDEANKISNYSNAEPIQLDNAYFEKDFAKVVDLWHESTDKNITDPIDQRRVMIAYSLMKCNEFSEAKKVAKPLDSSGLNQRIEAYQQFYDANKILENKLKNGNLSKKDQEKAKKQIEENKEAMDKL